MEHPTALTVDESEGCVKVSGEIDMSSATKLIDAVLKATPASLDLSGVTFIDSSGLHALIRLRRARAELRIVALSPQVRRLLEITNTSEHLLGDPTNPGRVAAPTAKQ